MKIKKENFCDINMKILVFFFFFFYRDTVNLSFHK